VGRGACRLARGEVRRRVRQACLRMISATIHFALGPARLSIAMPRRRGLSTISARLAEEARVNGVDAKCFLWIKMWKLWIPVSSYVVLQTACRGPHCRRGEV
jgi:hypothetical protein